MATRLAAYLVAFIVGTTFIAGLIVGAQRDNEGPVDLVVVNGRVYTADGEGTMAEAVAIQGNKILRVGTTREIQRLRRAQTIVIDAKGGAVVPGFIDGYAPFLSTDATLSHISLLDEVRPKPTRLQELAALRDATTDAYRRGVTSVQNVGGTAYALDTFDELRREGVLGLRVYGSLSARQALSNEELDRLDDLRARYADDPLFKAGAVEVDVDSDRAEPWLSLHALNRLVAALDERDWQIVIRARGERALAMALDAFKHAIDTNPVPARGRRHRIEPEGIMGPVDFARFDAIGVVHAPVDADSVQEEIDAVTRDAAWTSFDEQRKGSLARDMLADVVILSKDIFALPMARLSDIEVTHTIFDGRVVFRKTAQTDN